LQNTCWRESRGHADWVIITAVDEHLHIPGSAMRDYLAAMKSAGVTYVPALGYQMISETFPDAHERLCETRTYGAPFWQMNKLSVFDPAAIAETQFAPGRHSAHPSGLLHLPARDELLLLHYKYMDFERLCRREALLLAGLGSDDLPAGYATHYSWTRDRLRAEWDKTLGEAMDIASPDLRAWDTHPVPRWWRAPLAFRAWRLSQSVKRRLA
jgi:hypothetical protein